MKQKLINNVVQGMLPFLTSAGATRNALTKGMIEQLEFDLPSMNVQKKIVAVLDYIQHKIRLNQQINDNLAA